MNGQTADPAGARPWLVLVAALIVATLIAYVGPMGLALTLALPMVAARDPALIEGAFNLIIFGALIIAALVAARLTGGRIMAGLAPVLAMPAGVAAGLGGVGMALVLSGLAGVVQPGGGAPFSVAAFAGGTLVMLFQTGAEEVYFRGWLQPVLQRSWGVWPGILATAGVFALVHFASAIRDPQALPVLILAGLWFGVLASRSRGLVLPIAAHFGWNWGEGLLWGAAPNPGVGNFGSLYDYDLAGSVLWGGGPDGLDTSLSSLFALAALIAVCVLAPGLARTAARTAV
ncbi:type II CAAX endopeptidase family protein [Novosphingobium sp.]|uniref:CPBP family intramembrane glutamic endopeptidase n=1 Tax=Novosphingobium sp. TaxID=1874826 RepID=UPI00333EEE83